jgi:hypothetical protein
LVQRIISTAAKRPEVTDQLTAPLWEVVRKRVGTERLALLQDAKLVPAKYGAYCAASVAFFQEITNLEQTEAGLLLRQICSDK